MTEQERKRAEELANDYLAHVGVLGMRWGVRKNRTAARRNEIRSEVAKAVGLKGVSKAFTEKAKGQRAKAQDLTKKLKEGRTASEEHATTAELRKKSPKALTNAELKKVTERMQLEKAYKSLTPSKYKKGKALVTEILAIGALGASVAALAKNPAVQAVAKSVVEYAANVKVLGKVVGG